jgi:hypothetical protein
MAAVEGDVMDLKFLYFLRLIAVVALVSSCSARAVENQSGDAGPATDEPSAAFKFTAGLYEMSGGALPDQPGLDVNLRASGGWAGSSNVWVGLYRSPAQAIKQYRAGWDNSFELGAVRFMPSLQIASGGFVGGSAYFETGSSWFAGAGLGRTNLRPYTNLNFDPNDAYTLAGGYRWNEHESLMLQVVKDNRLNPDQQNMHLVFRRPANGDDRVTIDLLLKRGLVAGVPIQRTGFSVGYDWPRFFVRLSWDPLVNFTTQDMVRLSVGTRF